MSNRKGTDGGGQGFCNKKYDLDALPLRSRQKRGGDFFCKTCKRSDNAAQTFSDATGVDYLCSSKRQGWHKKNALLVL
jgi:hypothetical protein